jgi:hypothetical protein
MDYIFISMAHFAYHLKSIDATVHSTPFGLYVFAKYLLKIEKRWVKTGKNGEISGRDESF